MTTTTVTIDDTKIGTVISPGPDQYITRMVLTKAQAPPWQQENFIATPFPDGRWSGRFVLRDQGGAGRRLLSFATQSGVLFAGRVLMTDGQSFQYRGDLLLECLPRNQEWEVDFSDVPVARAAA